ncbi:hypothetical protein FJO69_01365 [[Mycoplasma] falconis]|uniref:Uncharacterized protein n=1 Tax=[Mycoplasma] falconis TaxID=92403 RepID=A0A501XB90_9BACT|nr:hypothetical protein [[Mycoplasma] falconis]TPE57564.1 hypothetical protein FJO69_01365 [[Mycoplasma] falconis]
MNLLRFGENYEIQLKPKPTTTFPFLNKEFKTVKVNMDNFRFYATNNQTHEDFGNYIVFLLGLVPIYSDMWFDVTYLANGKTITYHSSFEDILNFERVLDGTMLSLNNAMDQDFSFATSKELEITFTAMCVNGAAFSFDVIVNQVEDNFLSPIENKKLLELSTYSISETIKHNKEIIMKLIELGVEEDPTLNYEDFSPEMISNDLKENYASLLEFLSKNAKINKNIIKYPVEFNVSDEEISEYKITWDPTYKKHIEEEKAAQKPIETKVEQKPATPNPAANMFDFSKLGNMSSLFSFDKMMEDTFNSAKVMGVPDDEIINYIENTIDAFKDQLGFNDTYYQQFKEMALSSLKEYINNKNKEKDNQEINKQTKQTQITSPTAEIEEDEEDFDGDVN